MTVPLHNNNTAATGGHGRKATIHVTNISMDRARLQNYFRSYAGFKRISFHQEYIFVCFHHIDEAAAAIEKIHRETDMSAAYAKHGVASNSTPSIQVAPNPILYVSIFPFFHEDELTTIFRTYEGFDSCRFFPTHALVRFANLEQAKKVLEELNSTTNLFANYSTKGAKSESKRYIHESDDQLLWPTKPNSSSRTADVPTTIARCTIHVTNLDSDIASLWETFKGMQGFSRVAFYVDYAFVIFKDTVSSSHAIEDILFGSRMKANFARAEYTPHVIPFASLSTPNAILRVSDYPQNASEQEMVKFFSLFQGYVDITFYHSSCLVQFLNTQYATHALEEINQTTNFTTIYSRKGALAATTANPCHQNGLLDQRDAFDALGSNLYNFCQEPRLDSHSPSATSLVFDDQVDAINASSFAEVVTESPTLNDMASMDKLSNWSRNHPTTADTFRQTYSFIGQSYPCMTAFEPSSLLSSNPTKPTIINSSASRQIPSVTAPASHLPINDRPKNTILSRTLPLFSSLFADDPSVFSQPPWPDKNTNEMQSSNNQGNVPTLAESQIVAKSLIDDLFWKLRSLEAENFLLRRKLGLAAGINTNQQEVLLSETSILTTSVDRNTDTSSPDSGNCSISNKDDSEFNLKQEASYLRSSTHFNSNKSSVTAEFLVCETATSSPDWSASFEAAIEEIVRLRSKLHAQINYKDMDNKGCEHIPSILKLID